MQNTTIGTDRSPLVDFDDLAPKPILNSFREIGTRYQFPASRSHSGIDLPQLPNATSIRTGLRSFRRSNQFCRADSRRSRTDAVSVPPDQGIGRSLGAMLKSSSSAAYLAQTDEAQALLNPLDLLGVGRLGQTSWLIERPERSHRPKRPATVRLVQRMARSTHLSMPAHRRSPRWRFCWALLLRSASEVSLSPRSSHSMASAHYPVTADSYRSSNGKVGSVATADHGVWLSSVM